MLHSQDMDIISVISRIRLWGVLSQHQGSRPACILKNVKKEKNNLILASAMSNLTFGIRFSMI